jgi:hypothetical protein
VVSATDPHGRYSRFSRSETIPNVHKLIYGQTALKERRQTAQLKLESQERNLINNIKKKRNQNKSIVTKADIGNTVVILNKEDYNNKIEEFIT